jgi:hypothetical protein
MVAGRLEAGDENTSNGNYRYSIGFMDIFSGNREIKP